MDEVTKIINKYGIEHNVKASRKFAAALSEHPECQFSHMAIAYWQSGETQPTDDNLALIISCYDDWRKDMAVDCLKARELHYRSLVEAAQQAAPAPTD